MSKISVRMRCERRTRARCHRAWTLRIGRVACLMALVAWPHASAASLVVPAALSELTDEARVIVHGQVTSVEARWVDGRRRIESWVTVTVESYFKGDLGETITFRTPGGTFGAYRTVVVGAPVLAEGDDVVLFLGARAPAVPYVIGLNQGIFRVVRQEVSGQRFVVPPLLRPRGNESGRLVRGASSRRPVALDTFGSRLRELVSGAEAGGAAK